MEEEAHLLSILFIILCVNTFSCDHEWWWTPHKNNLRTILYGTLDVASFFILAFEKCNWFNLMTFDHASDTHWVRKKIYSLKLVLGLDEDQRSRLEDLKILGDREDPRIGLVGKYRSLKFVEIKWMKERSVDYFFNRLSNLQFYFQKFPQIVEIFVFFYSDNRLCVGKNLWNRIFAHYLVEIEQRECPTRTTHENLKMGR